MVDKVLVEPQDIRVWVEARGGYPIMMDTPDPVQGTRSLLQLTFDQHALNADNNEGPDRAGGFDLVDWDAWLTAFKAQDLVLVVDADTGDHRLNDYRIMSRGEAEQGPPT